MASERITQDWILARFDTLYPAHLGALWQLLVVLRRHFDGDLDAMMILLAISVGTEREDWRVALLDSWQPKRRTRPTNTLSIAQTTGIPRESVRRKLKVMAEKGWVVRDPNGSWEPTRAAADDLRPATWETVEYLQKVVGAALAARPEPPRDG